jgi:hypothetical protein
MLTTQESLEAMAGRSADGKPLVFESRADYDALRTKYEELLRMSKIRYRNSRWQVASVAAIASVAVVIGGYLSFHRSAEALIEPFGKGYYTSNDVTGVHAANAFCMARKEERRMWPVDTSGTRGLLFKCVWSAEEEAADARVKDPSSPEHRAKCADLREKMQQAEDETKGSRPDAELHATQTLLQLAVEADTLKCQSNP